VPRACSGRRSAPSLTFIVTIIVVSYAMSRRLSNVLLIAGPHFLDCSAAPFER